MRHPTTLHTGPLPDPVNVLERHLYEGGMSLIRAVFENSFFVAPDTVRQRTPYYPDRARLSREHYPGILRGGYSEWKGRKVKCGDNSRAQLAWTKYTGRPIARASGYGVRHIWGNPWNPDAFTAGWNLCYMPFWAGMLTEDQHPHDLVVQAVQQASWNLFFCDKPVCERPTFVNDPGLDLSAVLEDGPILLLVRETKEKSAAPALGAEADISDRIRAIRRQKNQSWLNIEKGALALLGRVHAAFGTANVESASKSVVKRMLWETAINLEDLLRFVQTERERMR